MTLARFDPVTSEWVLLLTDVDTDRKTASAFVDRLSFFALVAQGAETPVTPLPGVGDVTPPLSLLMAGLLAGLAALASGVYLLRRPGLRKIRA